MAAVDPRALIKDHEKRFQAEEKRAELKRKQAQEVQVGVGLAMAKAMTKRSRALALKRSNDARKLKRQAAQKAKHAEVAAKRRRVINGN